MQSAMVNAITTALRIRVSHSALEEGEKKRVSAFIEAIPHELLLDLSGAAVKNLSASAMMYICCFVAGVEAESIAAIFNVDVSSVYRAKHRIRKMFPSGKLLPF